MTTSAETQALSEHKNPPHLSLTSFSICLGILLAIFAFLNPIWRADEMSAWNENIWWSYIPIPLLVLVFLKLEGKLEFSALLLDSMKLTFVKFVITITAANVLWEFWGTPGTGEPEGTEVETQLADSEFALASPPPATALDPNELAAIEGVLLDTNGAPIAGATLWIDAGLDGIQFAAPPQPTRLTHDGTGYQPSFAVAQSWQVVDLQSSDSVLHTTVLEDESGGRVFNYPLIAGESRQWMFKRQRGLLRMSCSVHGAEEASATLLVTGSPFHARTDSEGRFRFGGVPAGDLRLAGRALDGRRIEQAVSVEAGGSQTLTLSLD